jgi:hypothetical protein
MIIIISDVGYLRNTGYKNTKTQNFILIIIII